ncbi:MAG TPA: MATE family efflux transporter [Candidatus Eisenbergiella pullistercoris]|uniref:Probable multidrug resistance protein NorM n=1 Tax=Candidatus Eisenbergiella pullistercoris TaxID=2838555 RepID=A0A9D1YPF7_9FIRM|nr:MATE family efflux transporter [Candidatus Eisenbergiella pullistercoris]
MKNSSQSVPMTEGSIARRLTAFAIPLFLGNLFQQLYNTADSLIVGNFLGSEALAAVSSSGSLIFLMVGFFNGISIGAGVVIARYYGARQIDRVQKAIHTTVAFGLVAGVLLTVIGLVLAPLLLVWMGTPENVLPNSIVYFRIYFCGSIAFVLYNIFVGILQSVGDSTHPLIYLIISSVVNIVLDLLFVGGFHMGVGSAAFATILSQFVSAILCLIQLLRSPEEYRIDLKKIRFHGFYLKQIIQNGLPSGFQNSIISVANVVVQANINSFGALAMAGCGAYSKIEGFGFLPITCFAMSLTTFISQNLGAGQYERAKKGARFGILCSVIMAELVGLVINLAAPLLIAAFNNDPDMIAYGVAQARTVTLFYFLLSFSHCVAGILRGAGRATVPMLVMLVCWCVIRISYITVAVRFIPSIRVIFWAYPLTWCLSSILFLIYFLKADWLHGFDKQA